MTKQQELELLEKIDALIKSADAGDYIPMTFDRIVEVCRRNIENDFGNSPVIDLEELRGRFDFEVRAHNETKKQLAESQKMYREALGENERLRKQDKEHGEYLLKLEHENNVLAEKLKTAESNLADYKGICQHQSEKIAEMQEGLDVCTDTMDQDEKDIAELQNEIIRLKAEIYDLRRELNK